MRFVGWVQFSLPYNPFYLVDEKTQEEVSLEEQVILFITVNTSPQGLISVPAPCQYARKLTFLVAQSIHKEPSLELANSLFYL